MGNRNIKQVVKDNMVYINLFIFDKIPKQMLSSDKLSILKYVL